MSQTCGQKRITISEVVADCHKLIIPQRPMQPSIAPVSEQLDPRCSQQTCHCHNQLHKVFAPWPVSYYSCPSRVDPSTYGIFRPPGYCCAERSYVLLLMPFPLFLTFFSTRDFEFRLPIALKLCNVVGTGLNYRFHVWRKKIR